MCFSGGSGFEVFLWFYVVLVLVDFRWVWGFVFGEFDCVAVLGGV